MKRYQIEVFGKVQGVFFRANTVKKATNLNIVGYVMNKHDRSVYAEAEGTEENIKEFIKWCHIGSPQSKVTQVVTTEVKILNVEKEFKIQR